MTQTKPTEPEKVKLPTGHRDPILQELWAVKARINEQANYSVAEIVKRLLGQQSALKH